MADEINRRTLADLVRAVGPEQARDLVRFFLEESRERLRRMADLAATDDFASLCREAHSLKSAAETYGARTLGENTRDVETACRDGALEEARRLFQKLAETAGRQLDDMEAAIADLTA